MTRLILDMVHHNPGEEPFETRFLDAKHLASYGYNGQVFKHINCVTTFDELGLNLFPDGSPEHHWIKEQTHRIEKEIDAAKSAGLSVFYHIDLFVLPKRLVQHFADEIQDPRTGKISLESDRILELHRVMFNELALCFPDVEGFIVRVGETYLLDTPYHTGNGSISDCSEPWTPTYLYEETLNGKPLPNKWGSPQSDTYVRLIDFLRREICERSGKTLIFRTWDIFPDRLHACPEHYLHVTNRIKPHDRLIFSIKHTSLDFWRWVKPNECLTLGRHKQIIEVQSQREYEGKGAYPNYVMHGVIDGFEENPVKVGLKDWLKNPKIVGIYGWSRGGGWYGPYIDNELWPDLNAYVLAGYTSDPSKSEEQWFDSYARDILRLTDTDIPKFRKLCLLSSEAILKGRHCEAFDSPLNGSLLPTACWMRDDRIGGEDQLKLVLEHLDRHGNLDAALQEKKEAVRVWSKIGSLAQEIKWPDSETEQFVSISCDYGRHLFEIVYHGWRIMIAARRDEAASEIKDAIRCYDYSWKAYRSLTEHPQTPSLYTGNYFSLPGESSVPGLDQTVDRYRTAAT